MCFWKRGLSIGLTAVLCLCLLAGCGGGDGSSSQSWAPDPNATYDKDDPQLPSVSIPSGGSSSTPASVPPQDSSSQSVSSESSKPPQPAPEFTGSTPSVVSTGKTVQVKYETNVSSTVNAIISTSGEKINTTAFYDYFNRGKALDGAVAKKTTYSIDSGGKTESYELPDATKSYYLLVNAVENETGTWQSYITVIPLFDPLSAAPVFVQGPSKADDNGGNLVFTLEANLPAKVYVLITAKDASAPTPAQLAAAGSGYGGTLYGSYSLSTATASPYGAKVEIPKSSLAAGSYAVWFTLQGTHAADAPFTTPAKVEITV